MSGSISVLMDIQRQNKIHVSKNVDDEDIKIFSGSFRNMPPMQYTSLLLSDERLQPRYYHVSVSTPDSIYIFGGRAWRDTNNFVKYELSSNRLTTLTLGPSPRAHMTMNKVGTKLIVIGGEYKYYSSLTPYGNVWHYDILTDAWTEVTMTQLRTQHSAVTYDGKIYVFGGLSDPEHKMGFHTTFDRYDPSSDTWDLLSATGPPPRAGHSAIVYNDKMYVYGGYNDTKILDELWIYDFIAGTWTQSGNHFKPAKFEHSVVVYNDVMYILGGQINFEAPGSSGPPQSPQYGATGDVILGFTPNPEEPPSEAPSPTNGDVASINLITEEFRHLPTPFKSIYGQTSHSYGNNMIVIAGMTKNDRGYDLTSGAIWNFFLHANQALITKKV